MAPLGRARRTAIAALALGAIACSGGKFSASGGAGTSAGGVPSSSGGSGGSSSGGDGTVPSGGTAGSVIGPGGQPSVAGFPATPVLDDFNRADGAPGLNWIGPDTYTISGEQIHCDNCGAALAWATPFGAEQEAFATLSGFGTDASEINLILKAQSSDGCDFIEVIYAPNAQLTRLDWCATGVWTQLDPKPLSLAPGDQFGARAHADGTVEIYVNGVSMATFDGSAFPYGDGRIGVDGLGGVDGLHWDDFGGGDWTAQRR